MAATTTTPGGPVTAVLERPRNQRHCHKTWTRSRGPVIGDSIENLTKAGNSPAWSTVRARYWKNAANDALEGEYSASNLARMQAGKPPLHDELGVPMELNHIIPRSQGGGHTLDNLEPLWPWEHAAVDPYRFYTGPTP